MYTVFYIHRLDGRNSVCSSIFTPPAARCSCRRLLLPQAKQLISLTTDVRKAVLAGRVYAVQTRNFSEDKETIRCGRINLSRGALHLHCLGEGPPPPGSITIEVSGSGLSPHVNSIFRGTSITDPGRL